MMDMRVEMAVSVAFTASCRVVGEQDLTDVMENPIGL